VDPEVGDEFAAEWVDKGSLNLQTPVTVPPASTMTVRVVCDVFSGESRILQARLSALRVEPLVQQ
jgi:hypothetical protein